MLDYMTKKSTALTFNFDPDLEKKFREASQKRSSIHDFISEFLNQFVARATKKAYVQDLHYFFSFLRSGGVIITHPSDIQPYHFQIYRDHMSDKGLASATISRRLVCIRSFMKWAVAARLATFNPLDVVRLPKVQTVSPTVAFDDIEVMAMVNAPDISTHKGRVHRLIIVLLFNLGLRRAELINVRISHFFEDRGHKVLKVYGKGDKVRLLPISDFVLSEIESYIAHLKAHNIVLEENDFLLQTKLKRKNKGPIDGSTIYRVVSRYAKVLGINKKVSPHSCRATVISHLLDTRHTPIRDVASFAGHANITTTEGYDKRRNNLNKNAAYDVDFDIKKVD